MMSSATQFFIKSLQMLQVVRWQGSEHLIYCLIAPPQAGEEEQPFTSFMYIQRGWLGSASAPCTASSQREHGWLSA